MTASELDWLASQVEDADATEQTKDDDEQDATEQTQDDDEDATEQTQDEEISVRNADGNGRTLGTKIPPSEIIVRDIAVERHAPLVDLPADTDAAFGQWLAGSRLMPPRH